MGCIPVKCRYVGKPESVFVNKNFESPAKKNSVKIKEQNERRSTDYNTLLKKGGTLNMTKKAYTIKIEAQKFYYAKNYPVEYDYEILEKLGSGAYGQVYKVRQRKSGLIRAMKEIDKIQNHKFFEFNVESFEGDHLMKLDHPNILNMYDYYITDSSYQLIVEFIQGGELYDTIIKFKNFTEKTASKIMYQILSAVSYLHSKDLIHRDIKPENCLVEISENMNNHTTNMTQNTNNNDKESINKKELDNNNNNNNKIIRNNKRTVSIKKRNNTENFKFNKNALSIVNIKNENKSIINTDNIKNHLSSKNLIEFNACNGNNGETNKTNLDNLDCNHRLYLEDNKFNMGNIKSKNDIIIKCNMLNNNNKLSIDNQKLKSILEASSEMLNLNKSCQSKLKENGIKTANDADLVENRYNINSSLKSKDHNESYSKLNDCNNANYNSNEDIVKLDNKKIVLNSNIGINASHKKSETHTNTMNNTNMNNTNNAEVSSQVNKQTLDTKIIDTNKPPTQSNLLSKFNSIKNESIRLLGLEQEKINFNIILIDFGACTHLKKGDKLSLKFGTPYYIAPEVLKKSYDFKSDIWSCGIILHTLLIGYPPFLGKDNKEILAKVESANINYDGPKWQNISSEAKNLIKKMLERDPEKRISAEEALRTDWLNVWKDNSSNQFDETLLSDIQKNIREFSAIEKFQQAALAYIVHINNSSSQNHELRTVFKSFDINGDGKLSYSEFMEGYKKISGKKVNEYDIRKIISQMDQNMDEFIEYEEFLRLSLNQAKLVSELNLKLAFDNFDHDKNGSLSKDEIRQVLINADDEYIDELFLIIDTNQDNTINFEEFKKMMEILVSNK